MTERLSTSGRPMLGVGAPADGARSLLHRRRRGMRARSHRRRCSRAGPGSWRARCWRRMRCCVRSRAKCRHAEAIAGAVAARHRWNRNAVPLYLRTDLSFGVRRRRVRRPHRRRAERARQRRTADSDDDRAGADGAVLTSRCTMSPCRALLEFQRAAHASVLNAVFVDETLRARRRPPGFVRLPALQPEQLRRPAARPAPRRAVRPRVQRIGDLDEPTLGAPAEVRGHRRRGSSCSTSTRADLIVVVSRAMRDELVDRHVDARTACSSIPNAVDPARYTTRSIDGGVIRRRFALDGPHRARIHLDVSALARRRRSGAGVRRRCSSVIAEHRDSSRLLDDRRRTGAGGQRARHRRGRVRRRPSFSRAWSRRRKARRIWPPATSWSSPHVPNADGSPFFGSPHQAVRVHGDGQGIVASDLDQIGEVLRHGETGVARAAGRCRCAGRRDGAPGARSGAARCAGAAARREALLPITRGTPTCNGRSTRWTPASTPAPHDGEAPARDLLGHAAAVRAARGAGEPNR